MFRRIILAALLATSTVGCRSAEPAAHGDTIHEDNIEQCHKLCESAKMELQSIVIVAKQTGCVCGYGPQAGAAAAAGGAVAALVAEQQRQTAKNVQTFFNPKK